MYIDVCGYELDLDWFDGKRSMYAFAYAIERAVAIKEQAKDSSYILTDSYNNAYNVQRINIKLDGIDSRVSIDNTWIVGCCMNPDNGDRIYATKKEVDEFFSDIVLYKPIRLNKKPRAK